MKEMMKAVTCPHFGDADIMLWEDVPLAKPSGEGQVLIQVKAAGVNRPDVLQRQGKYEPPIDASQILGLEVAGTIVQTYGNTCWTFGDRVCALTHGGGYAEYVWVDERHCLRIPDGWTEQEAATIPETYFTVWYNLFMNGELGKINPETLLIHGGASGIGTAAIQLAKAFSNKVVITARREEQLKACLKLGADFAFRYDGQWIENVRKSVGRIDVVLDFLGQETFEGNVKILENGGRIIWLAYLTGQRIELDIPKIMAKQIRMTGSFLRPQNFETKAKIASELQEYVWPKIEEGMIRPQIAATFNIQDVVEAHRLMERGGHIGKIVLTL